MPVYDDRVAQRLADRGERAVVGEVTAEQAIDSLTLVDEIDAHPGREQQVGLTRLDEQPGEHAAVMQVPSALADIGLGPDASGAEHAGFRVDAGDTVGQQQRRLGHSNLTRVAVLLPE